MTRRDRSIPSMSRRARRQRPRRPRRAARLRQGRLLLAGAARAGAVAALSAHVARARPVFVGALRACCGWAFGPSDAGQTLLGWAEPRARRAVRLRGQRSPQRRARAARLPARRRRRAGASRDDAERRFFRAWLPRQRDAARRRARRRAASGRADIAGAEAAAARREEVIGLFPQAVSPHARRHHRLRLGQPPLRRQGLRARGARERLERLPIKVTAEPDDVRRGRPHRAARRRRLRRLQAGPRRASPA